MLLRERDVHAVAATRAAGGKVAITLSDPFCVERHRAVGAKGVRCRPGPRRRA